MPALPTLRIEQSDGTERDTLDCIRAVRTQSLVEMWRAEAVVDRSDWLAVKPNVDEISDRFIVRRGDGTTLQAGRIGDDVRGEGQAQNTVRILIQSYERDAKDAEPSGGNLVYQNVNDDQIVTEAINDVGTLTAGTLETGESAVSMTFAHAAPSKRIRDAAEPAGQDIAYRNDRTVDFLDRLGSDKPNVAIRSTDQNIVDTLSVEDNSLDPVTHIRGLGGEQGPNQVQATATIGSYQQGDRQVWREYVNKDVVQQSRMQDIVDRLATEANNNRRRLTVEAGLDYGVDVSIGDSLTVDLAEHDINRLLRVVELREILSSARRYVATLTNRSAERGGSRKRRDDLNRFNTGYQGFVDRDNFRAVERQPVTSATNATGEYPYPDDVETEIKSELVVRSVPYRAYSSGAASGGGTTESSTNNDEYSRINFNTGSTTAFSGTGSEETVDTYSPGGNTAWMQVTFSIGVSGLSGGVAVNTVKVQRQSDGFNWENAVRFASDNSEGDTSASVIVPQNVAGDTFDAIIDTDSNLTYDVTTVWSGVSPHTHDVTLPDHTHPVDPGLIEFGNETASGVDVVVNGTTEATDIGSGKFTETIDLSGVFVPGVNDIEIVSDSLGLVTAYVQTQLFRRGRDDP